MGQMLFVFWITVLPFIMIPDVFEGAKVWWFWLLGIGLALYWLKHLVQNKPFSISVAQGVFALWIVVLCIASVLGVHPIDSIIGGSYRHQGIIFFLILFLVSLTLPFLSKKSTSVCVHGLALGVLVQATYIYIQALTAHVTPWGTFGEVNAVAGYLAIGMIFLAYIVRRRFFVSLVACLFVLGSIFLTGSRSGLVVCGVGILIVIARQLRIRGTMWKLLLLAVGVFFVGAMALYISWLSDMHPTALSYEDRWTYWRLAVEGIQERPILGYGAESGEVVYARLFLQEHVRLIDFMVDRAHNILLDVSLWGGVIGLMLFMGWIISGVIERVRTKQWYWVIGIVSWLLYAWVQPAGVVLWVMLVLFLGLPSVTESQTS